MEAQENYIKIQHFKIFVQFDGTSLCYCVIHATQLKTRSTNNILIHSANSEWRGLLVTKTDPLTHCTAPIKQEKNLMQGKVISQFQKIPAVCTQRTYVDPPGYDRFTLELWKSHLNHKQRSTMKLMIPWESTVLLNMFAAWFTETTTLLVYIARPLFVSGFCNSIGNYCIT